jgi:xylulokinase
MSVMGLDIGTSGCKAVLMSLDGKILRISHREYGFKVPRPGWLEMDPEMLWVKVKEVIAESTSCCTEDPVESVCIATMGDSFVPVDKKGNATGPFILASDNRSVDETMMLIERIGRERIFKLTGMPPYPINTVTKVFWIKNNQKDLFDRTSKFLCCEEYIIGKLTGLPVTSYSSASRTMAFDVNNKNWSDEILSAAGLSSMSFPEAVPSGTTVGNVESNLCRDVFNSNGVCVVTGGMDQTCATLGANAFASGRILNSMGTIEVLAPTIDRNVIEGKLEEGLLSGGFSVNEHVIPGKVLIMGLVINAGSTIRWFRDEFVFGSEKEFFKLFDDCDKKLTPLMFFPYLSGRGTPKMNPNAAGMWWGLDFSEGRRELFQAVLQGITYEAYKNLEALKILGIPVSSITCVGGGARSLSWLQLKANVFGVPVTQNLNNDAAGIGAGILAGKEVGYWNSIEEAASKFASEEKILEVHSEHAVFLEKHYELFNELYNAALPYYKKFKEVHKYLK